MLNLSIHFLVPSPQLLNYVGFIRKLCIFECSLLQSLLQKIMPILPCGIKLSECSLLQTLLQKTVIHRSFAYVSIITKNPQTLTVQGLSADGVKWTRTIDPHDVNVIL